MTTKLKALQFPIGEFKVTDNPTETQVSEWIKDIEIFPSQLKEVIKNTSAEALAYKYRPNGWTVNQVVHHCADSHINAFLRLKLSLTENNPTIRPYFEDRFGELIDSLDTNLTASLQIITGIHFKWTQLLKSLTVNDLQKTFFHPEHQTTFTILENIQNYSWHCKHHLQHVKNAINSNGIYN